MTQQEFESLSTNQQFYEWLRALDTTPIEMRQFEALSSGQQFFQIYDAVEGPYEQRKFESLPTGRQFYQIYAELAASPISQVQFESVSVGMQLYYLYAATELTPMSRQKFLSLTRSQQLWYLVGSMVGAGNFGCTLIDTIDPEGPYTYVQAAELEGRRMRIRIRATNSQGSATSWTDASDIIAPPDPPLLWWKLNEGSGTAIAAENGPAGTTDADWIVRGSGFGLDFNGTSDNASSDAVVEYGGAGIITVVLNKVTFDDITTTQILFESSALFSGNARTFLAYIDAGELWALCSDSGGGANAQYEKIVCPSIGVERSLAFVFNTAAAAGDVKFFVNAVEQAGTLVSAGHTITSTFADHNFFLGSRNNASVFFNGKIDDVRIYGRELNAADLTAVMGDAQ